MSKTYDWFDSFSIIKEISFTVMTSFSNFFDTAVKKPTIFSKTSWFNDSFGISGIAVPCKAKIWRNFEIFLTFQSKNDVRRAVPLSTKNRQILYHTWHLYLALTTYLSTHSRIHSLTFGKFSIGTAPNFKRGNLSEIFDQKIDFYYAEWVKPVIHFTDLIYITLSIFIRAVLFTFS